MSLNTAQQRVLEMVMKGDNVFITGGAGVGKSFLVNHIREALRLEDRNVKLTASTGTAATLINGQTLHSLVGLGLASEPIDVLIKKARNRPPLRRTWRALDTLIIDEVSMIDPEFFVKTDHLARAIRGSDLPFGGIQLVCVGDFYQLAPVIKQEAPYSFVFETASWKDGIDHCVELTEIFRQDNDSEFARLLQRVRVGDTTPDDLMLLASRVNQDVECCEGVIPTSLYSRRMDVASVNDTHLNDLDVDTRRVFTATMTCDRIIDSSQVIKTWKNIEQTMPADKTLDLRVGAQVMMIVNSRELGLVNGSRGVVLSFNDEGHPRVRFSDGVRVMAPHTWIYDKESVGTFTVRQVPLQLAWALTIHKSQGASLDCAKISLDRSVFAYGQAYVAMSRVRSIDGMKLVKFNASVIRANPKVHEFYASMTE